MTDNSSVDSEKLESKDPSGRSSCPVEDKTEDGGGRSPWKDTTLSSWEAPKESHKVPSEEAGKDTVDK